MALDRSEPNAMTRAKARQNLQVATVNVALERRLITLDPAPFKTSNFEFELAGLPILARVRDAGFDEVSVHAMVAPSKLGRNFIGVGLLHWRRTLCAAYVTGCLERRDGKYLQTSVLYNGTKDVTKVLSELVVVPNGFGVKPTKDGYDFHRVPENIGTSQRVRHQCRRPICRSVPSLSRSGCHHRATILMLRRCKNTGTIIRTS